MLHQKGNTVPHRGRGRNCTDKGCLLTLEGVRLHEVITWVLAEMMVFIWFLVMSVSYFALISRRSWDSSIPLPSSTLAARTLLIGWGGCCRAFPACSETRRKVQANFKAAELYFWGSPWRSGVFSPFWRHLIMQRCRFCSSEMMIPKLCTEMNSYSVLMLLLHCNLVFL